MDKYSYESNYFIMSMRYDELNNILKRVMWYNMGKYSYEFNVPVTYKYQLMQIIANELAEANRLKRLELEYVYSISMKRVGGEDMAWQT